jgi:hypothetical protein
VISDAEKEKIAKYEDLRRKHSPRAKMVPFVTDEYGRIGPEAQKMMKEVWSFAENSSHKSKEELHEMRSSFYSKLNFILANRNMDVVGQGLGALGYAAWKQESREAKAQQLQQNLLATFTQAVSAQLQLKDTDVVMLPATEQRVQTSATSAAEDARSEESKQSAPASSSDNSGMRTQPNLSVSNSKNVANNRLIDGQFSHSADAHVDAELCDDDVEMALSSDAGKQRESKRSNKQHVAKKENEYPGQCKTAAEPRFSSASKEQAQLPNHLSSADKAQHSATQGDKRSRGGSERARTDATQSMPAVLMSNGRLPMDTKQDECTALGDTDAWMSCS